jgi:predicted transcriptional regulator
LDSHQHDQDDVMAEEQERTEYLLEFFKAFADEKRLQIAGLLARQAYTVEELATILDLGSADVSHHLRKLQRAGLVRVQADQQGHTYSLQLELLHEKSQQILSDAALQQATDELDSGAYDRKVLRDFMEGERLKQIPRQWKKREVILRYLAEQFEWERRYTEKEVNEILSRTHEDYASLRRYLVDSHRLAREHEVYWRVDEE